MTASTGRLPAKRETSAALCVKWSSLISSHGSKLESWGAPARVAGVCAAPRAAVGHGVNADADHPRNDRRLSVTSHPPAGLPPLLSLRRTRKPRHYDRPAG